MKHLIIIFFGLAFMITACHKEENENSCNAIILERGLDCGDSYLIKLTGDISILPNNNTDNIWYTINLPEEFKVEGKKVIVEFREADSTELMTCTTLGLNYPQLFIVKIEERK